MSIIASFTKKLLTLLFLITLIFSSFGVKANADYYSPYRALTQPNCSNDILGRILSGVLYQGYSTCNYSNNCNQGYYSNCNNYNKYCDPNANVGKINSVYGDQNTTTTNNVTITVSGKISTSCDNNPIKVFVNVTDQYGNYLINNDSQYINVNTNCNVNNISFDCSNFTIQIQAQKSDFINKNLRVEMSFSPKNNYNSYGNYYTPFENSNISVLDSLTYFNNNNSKYNYNCSLYNCYVDYPIVPFGGFNDFQPIIYQPSIYNTTSGCESNPIDYYDNCYFF